jgi:plastocyanin
VKRSISAAFVAVAALVAAPALAANHTITGGPVPNTYATTSVTMDQGDTVTFVNQDTSGVKHDVTADKLGSDEKPLFKSELTDAGKSAPVAGVDFLTTGDYGYHCSIHLNMKGTLHVTASGTPRSRSTQPSDSTPPDASVAVTDSRIRAVLERKALKVGLTSNEAATFKLTAKVARTVIAKGVVSAKRGKTGASIALTRAGRRLLAKSHAATVRLTASVSDAAGNRAAASATRRLRR